MPGSGGSAGPVSHAESAQDEDMQPALSDTRFVLKRYGRVTSGRYRLNGLRQGMPLLFIKEQAEELSPLSTARVFEDEEQTREVLTLIDVESGGIEQEVVDAETGKKVGSIGLAVDASGDFVKDTWLVSDAAGKPVGKVLSRRSNRPVARAADAEPPQDMDITFGGALVGRLREKTNVVGYELAIDFSMDAANLLDRRLGLAVAIFAAFDKAKIE
jgi:hypothetical protein